MGDNENPSRSTDSYASTHDVVAMATEVKDLGIQVKAMDLTLKKVLAWLRGTYNDDGEYEPGLIEVNRRQERLIRGATKWALSLLATIATSAATIAVFTVAHALGLQGVKP